MSDIVELKLQVQDGDTVVKIENSAQALETLFKNYNLTEQSVQLLIKSLQEEKSALALGSEQYKEKTMLLGNMNAAVNSMKQASVQGGSAVSAMTNTVGQLGWALGDADMFLVNFRMGMMSIGNNIPMVVQGLTYVKKATQESGETFKEVLAKSLSGPGGVMLAVNGAMLAIQILTRVMASGEEQAKKSADAYKEAADAVIQFQGAGNAEKKQLTKDSLKGLDSQKGELVQRAVDLYMPKEYESLETKNGREVRVIKEYTAKQRAQMAIDELESGKKDRIQAEGLFIEYKNLNAVRTSLAEQIKKEDQAQMASDLAKPYAAKPGVVDALDTQISNLTKKNKAVRG